MIELGVTRGVLRFVAGDMEEGGDLDGLALSLDAAALASDPGAGDDPAT